MSYKSDYDGGYVKDPNPGRYEWVLSFDLNSLYPNLIVQYNMSPETIVKHMKVEGLTPERILANPNQEHWNPEDGLAIAANGACFRTDKQGILPLIVEEIYNQRVEVKKAMLAAQSELELLKKELQNEAYSDK
jgi:DNA polymerase elongation subunit (family B)